MDIGKRAKSRVVRDRVEWDCRAFGTGPGFTKRQKSCEQAELTKRCTFLHIKTHNSAVKRYCKYTGWGLQKTETHVNIYILIYVGRFNKNVHLFVKRPTYITMKAGGRT